MLTIVYVSLRKRHSHYTIAKGTSSPMITFLYRDPLLEVGEIGFLRKKQNIHNFAEAPGARCSKAMYVDVRWRALKPPTQNQAQQSSTN